MASPAVGLAGTFRQVGTEKKFSLEEDSGLHVTNRVREYTFTPLKESAAEPSGKGTPSKDRESSGLSESASIATSAMRLPVAAVGGALALVVLKTIAGKRKPKAKRTNVAKVPETENASPLGEASAATNHTEIQAPDVISVDTVSAVDVLSTPARNEDAEEWPEPGTPRSTRTVSSAGGGPSRSLSIDESQNKRLQSHRKEVVSKMRQQLQSRDEMILDMQRQLAAQEHFTRESRSIVAELEEQLKTALDGGHKLGLENQGLMEEKERLEAELSNEKKEKTALLEENRRLQERIAELEREDNKLESGVLRLQETMKQLERERNELESTTREQQGAMRRLEEERESLQRLANERESNPEAKRLTGEEELRPKMQAVAAENERLKEELQALKEESSAKAAQERVAVEKVKVVEKDLERLQKMLKGKERLVEGYEKERAHLTTVLKDLELKAESKQRELEAVLQSGTTAADVQSSNYSESPTRMADRDEEAHSRPRNMHLMKSFDNPLLDMSPEESPLRQLSNSKSHDSKLLDDSVYPSPNGVLENMPHQLSMDQRMKQADGSANYEIDVDALERELSDRSRWVSEKTSETKRLVQSLQRHKDLIVDLERKIGKEEELGIKEDSWLEGDSEEEDGEESPTELDISAQAAVLTKKLEQVAMQRAMDEKLAEIQQEESAMARLRSRMASLAGKTNGTETKEPSARSWRKTDVLGEELARKLALQERSPDALNEVQRISATFQRGSPLFAKAQDELVRRSMSGIEMMKAGRLSNAANVGGHRSADGLDRRYSCDGALGFKANGIHKEWSGNQQHGTFSVPNGAASDSPPSDGAPRDELARLTVEVERELSQDVGKWLKGHGSHDSDVRSQGSGEMDLGEEDETESASKKVGSEVGSDDLLADMLESTLDDMVRMCTPAPSQANSPFPNKLRRLQ